MGVVGKIILNVILVMACLLPAISSAAPACFKSQPNPDVDSNSDITAVLYFNWTGTADRYNQLRLVGDSVDVASNVGCNLLRLPTTCGLEMDGGQISVIKTSQGIRIQVKPGTLSLQPDEDGELSLRILRDGEDERIDERFDQEIYELKEVPRAECEKRAKANAITLPKPPAAPRTQQFRSTFQEAPQTTD